MKPLEGVTVVELSSYFAVPACGRVLATQGARVIKVEPPKGDVQRYFATPFGVPCSDEENMLFDTINEQARAQGLPELVAAGEGRPLGWGPARYFMFPGAQGTVGFISPLSRHFCGECNRLRLTADGKLRPCLFSDNEYNLRAALREGDEETQRAVFAEALRAKPDDHHDRVGTERGMSQIGG